MKNKFKPITNCIICGEHISRKGEGKQVQAKRTKRSRVAVTCDRWCAKAYRNVREHVSHVLLSKLRKKLRMEKVE